MNYPRKPRDEFKYVYFHKHWAPTPDGSLLRLLEEGMPVSIEEYDIERGKQKKYFCPRCGYPCRRVPTSGKPTVKGVRAEFRHFPEVEPRECNFRTRNSEGQKYLKEEEKTKAIEDGRFNGY